MSVVGLPGRLLSTKVLPRMSPETVIELRLVSMVNTSLRMEHPARSPSRCQATRGEVRRNGVMISMLFV